MAFIKTILCLLFSILLNYAFTQKGLELISKDKLQEDFNHLVKLIEAHPAPYIHISEEEHSKLIEDIWYKIDKDMSVLDFYKLITPVYSSIKDGHSSLNLNFDWYKKIRKETGIFPLKVFCDSNDRMYVVSDTNSENTIPLGSEILSINSKKVGDFINSIDPYISYERAEFRNFKIENGLNKYLIMQFGLRKSTKIKYVYETIENTIDVKHIKLRHWKKGQSSEYKDRRKRFMKMQPWEYKKINHDIGYFNIFSFRIASPINYDIALNNIFGEIKKDSLKSLIIDIRGNTGGFPKDVSKLLHFITQDNFRIMSSSAMKVSQSYKDYYKIKENRKFLQMLARKNDTYNIDMLALFASDNGEFIVRNEIYDENPILMNNEFEGDVYLLTDRRTYSASVNLAATLKCFYLGLIIGEETGGTQVFHGNSIHEKLKHTNLLLTMATTQIASPCSEKNTIDGVIPDFEIKPNVMQIISDQDLVLNFALRIIERVTNAREEKLKIADN